MASLPILTGRSGSGRYEVRIMKRPLLVSGGMALAAVLLTKAAALDQPDLTVPIRIGETKLTEIGLYRVGWQS